ncbi:glycosyltransferase [Rhodococcus tibetensis]|uniref:4,4'-diaponeurosporenoate glycosyltransferase n=1 Tax=Rhodococcus tibetensis TaxID=2965064 RepID=A0ABT1Q9T7_9NOCA|nr:glycosyltransferase family 2 protein [Rhodococcus sp. FXJ9.536]MCQ4119034.1 glycosyltransferase [Rhodococcus sp. FXJ9.536]
MVTAAANLRSAPRLRVPSRTITEPVTVCIPARNECRRLPALIEDLTGQRGVEDLWVLVFDDASTDDTAAIAEAAVAGDPRFTVVRSSDEPPPGWVGKPAACHRAREHAEALHPDRGGLLVFLDADVRLQPGALAAACSALRDTGAGLVCPWPFQESVSIAEIAVQPLLAWSWAASLPVRLANRSLRPSMAVACGQFMVFDSAAYHRVGGHGAVVNSLTEDLDIARLLRRRGVSTHVVAAGGVATCRMYEDARALRSGYDRWLWTAFGSRWGAVTALGMAGSAYLLPPAALAVGRGRVRRWGAVGYLAAVTSRLCARALERGASPTATDVAGAMGHPFSVTATAALTVSSHLAHHRGRTSWKGRALS